MFPDVPTDIFDYFNQTVDNFWAKPVTFVYPEVQERCINCYGNGVYKVGGPYPFDNGSICPLCDGNGYKSIEPTEISKARIYYNKKDWVKTGISVEIDNAVAQLIFSMSDITKIQKCKYIIPEYYQDINNYQGQKLFLKGSPFPQGFTQNPIKYIITYWGASK